MIPGLIILMLCDYSKIIPLRSIVLKLCWHNWLKPRLDYGISIGLDHGISIGLDHGISIGLDHGISIGLDHGISIGLDHGISIGLDHGISIGLDHGISIGLDYGISIGLDYGISIELDHGISIHCKKCGLSERPRGAIFSCFHSTVTGKYCSPGVFSYTTFCTV